MAEPEHLSNRHRDTLVKIFEHPTSRNVEWREVLSLLEAIATVEKRHDAKYQVTLEPESIVLERPKGKDVAVDVIVELRKLLASAGYEPAT